MSTTFLVPKNNANSKLAAAITAAATSLTVLTGEGARFPSTYPFHISIDSEILQVTNRSSDTFTVVRAQESTSAATHKTGANVQLNITAKAISDLNSAVNDIEGDIVTIQEDIDALETAPPAHSASHQNAGSDEISVAGLSGELADPQTPLAHKTSHESGGSDELKLDNLAAPDDNTDLNASTAKHGLCPKGDNDASHFLGGDLAWGTPSVSVSPQGLAIFGDGSDGDVTISSNTTLTRDMYYNNLTVDNGITLNTGCYAIFVKGTLTNNGTISNNGNNGATAGVAGGGLPGGSLGSSGAGGAGGGSQTGGGGGGAGAIMIAAKILTNNGTISANGGNGGPGQNVTGCTNTGSAGANTSSSLGGSGGAGESGGSYAGGAGGTASAPAASQGSNRHAPAAISLVTKMATARIQGGAGGGGGGCKGTPGIGGGGGGGGGGLIAYLYSTVTVGTIQVNGGTKGGTGTGGADGSAGTIIAIAN